MVLVTECFSIINYFLKCHEDVKAEVLKCYNYVPNFPDLLISVNVKDSEGDTVAALYYQYVATCGTLKNGSQWDQH